MASAGDTRQYGMLSKPPRSLAAQEMVETIVAAVDRCCLDREFDCLSVLDICNEADISISSFYARFPSKDELLRFLHARYLAASEEDVRMEAANLIWESELPDDFVSLVLGRYLALRRRNATTFRTMLLAELRHPELFRRRQWEDRRAMQELAELVVADWPDRAAAAEATERIVFVGRVVVAVVQDMSGLQRYFPEDLGQESDVLENLSELVSGYISSRIRQIA